MEKEVVLEGEGIQQVIEEVTLDINNGNEKFVRITDEEMPEILKFMEEQNNFSEWAFIGQGQRSTEEETEPEKEGENAGVPPSLSSSVFLRNFEEQMRLVRQEREEKWKLQQSMLEVPSEDQVVGNAGWAMIPPDPVGNEQIGLDQQTPGDSASAHCVVCKFIEKNIAKINTVIANGWGCRRTFSTPGKFEMENGFEHIQVREAGRSGFIERVDLDRGYKERCLQTDCGEGGNYLCATKLLRKLAVFWGLR